MFCQTHPTSLVPLQMGKRERLKNFQPIPKMKNKRDKLVSKNWQANSRTKISQSRSPISFINHSNESKVIIGGTENIAIIDTGAQFPIIMEMFYVEFGLHIYPLWGCLVLKGWGGYPYHIKVILKLYVIYLVIRKIYYF